MDRRLSTQAFLRQAIERTAGNVRVSSFWAERHRWDNSRPCGMLADRAPEPRETARLLKFPTSR
jgi:hypothetical protein